MSPLLSVRGLTLRRDDGEGSAILNVGPHLCHEWEEVEEELIR